MYAMSQSQFKVLGQRLRAMRQELRESVEDVSGAVEIDSATLVRIEQGQERPSEDILDLLISHFDIPVEEAENLWQLAGYNTSDEQLPTAKNTIMIMAVDPRIVYSDHLQASADQNGVVLNFIQKTGVPTPITAARVGMSRKQAARVARVIQEVLAASEPRSLPRPSNQKGSGPNKQHPESEQ